MATITKRDLTVSTTSALQDKGHDITQQHVLDIIQTLIDTIADSLAQGDTVVMRNFGVFHVREMKAKIGRNPKEPAKVIHIPACAAVNFKPGKELKERISGNTKMLG